ncbi:MAG: hypothetical protein ACREL2_05985 [Gemmatimonadales bacterium]
MIHCVAGILALVALAFALGRAGVAKGLRDPVTYLAIALIAGTLGPILRLREGSALDTTLLGVKIATTIYGCYLLLRRQRGTDTKS